MLLGGKHCLILLIQFLKRKFKNIHVVQITGGFRQVPLEINALDITRRVSQKLGAKAYLLYAPAILDNRESMKVIMKQPGISDTIKMYSSLKIALFGVGEVLPKPNTFLYKSGLISSEDYDRILASNAVGEIFGYFYDLDGEICSTPLDGKIVGMPAEQLKNVEYSICIACGKSKSKAIKAALTGKFAKVLVTDFNTAKYLATN